MGLVAFCQEGRQNLTKTLLVMKLTIAFLVAFSIQVGARAHSQDRITLSKKDATLESILQDISKQSGYDYAFQDKWNAVAKKIDISVVNMLLKDVLEICFKDQPFTYEVFQNIIIVKEKPSFREKSVRTKSTIRGKVVNEKGESLSGASIKEEGGNVLAITNNDGEFTITTLKQNIVLEISFTGYQKKIIRTNGEEDLNITMLIDISTLNQVQVIAYGTVSKRLNTGDVSTFKSEDIEKQPVSNVLGALDGRISGVDIQQTSGMAGSAYNVQIRGQNSLRNSVLNNGNLPLYIIDGVPFTSSAINSTAISSVIQFGNPLDALNPLDILSINILKDADATAIYGSRGANGVVLITTKKGRPGHTKIDLNTYLGTGAVSHFISILNTQQYLQIRHEAFANDATIPTVSNAQDILVWDTTRNTNWEKALLGGKSQINNTQLTVSGGNNNAQYSLSGNLNNQGSVLPGDFSDRKSSVHFSFNDVSDNNKFGLLMSATYLNNVNDVPTVDPTGVALHLAPDAPKAFNSDGSLNWQNSTWTNPYASLLRTYNYNANNLISSANISYHITDEFTLRANLGFNDFRIKEHTSNPLSSLNPVLQQSSKASANFANNSIQTWILEPQLEYERNSKIGKWNILIGSTFQQNIQEGQTISASGYTSDILLNNIGAAPSVRVSSNNYTQYRYNGFFGRINYNWKDKYLANLTARRDGSSRFGPGNQFANFGALGAAWIFRDDNNLTPVLSFLSFGKIRMSYGITGSDQIPDYGYLDTYSAAGFPYNGASSIIPTGIANNDYSWETTKKFEVGVDFGFFKNAILVSIGYYDNHTSNQLVGYSLAPTAGFPSVNYNLPAVVQNQGFELGVNTVNIKSKEFTWTTSFNLSVPKNVLVSYPNLAGSSYANTYVVGKSLYVRKLYHFTGVDPQSGIYTFGTKNGGSIPTYPDDLQGLKQVQRYFYGGLTNSFTYSHFDLDFFIQFVKQDGLNFIGSFGVPGTFNIGGTSGNQPVQILGRWEKPGDITSIQKLTQSFGSDAASSYFPYAQSDNGITDVSFIRLKNVSLSYQLPARWLAKVKMNLCKLYVQGQNLLTFTKFSGFDPENQSSSSIPPLRVITFGLRIIF